MAKQNSNEVSQSNVSQSKEVALFGGKNADMPAHVSAAGGRGNENVSATDQMVPTIKLVQSINLTDMQALTAGEAAIGDLLNSNTLELYKELFVVNLMFDKTFTVWKNMRAGGGKVGDYDSEEAAKEATAQLPQMPPEMDYDLVQTHKHILLLLDVDMDKGTAKISGPGQIYFKKTSIKTSAAWNTNIATKGGDRFAGIWRLSSKDETNKSGQTYKNWRVDFAGWAPENIYREAEETYNSIKGILAEPEVEETEMQFKDAAS